MPELHLRLHDTLTAKLTPLVPRTPGEVGRLHLRPDDVRRRPRRARPRGHRAGRAGAPPARPGARASPTCATSPTWTTRSSSAPSARACRRWSSRPAWRKLYQEDVRAVGCADARRASRKVSRAHRRDRRAHRGAHRPRRRLRGDDAERRARRLLRRPRLPRLRQALQAQRRRAARRRPRRGLRRQARPPRLRAVEGLRSARPGAGTAPGARAGPAGTSSARPWPERYLGHGFDVHCGGMDLIFPHHENEIAQSEAAHPGEGPSSRIWIHNGLRQRRQGEDVEVARQLRHHPRRARAQRRRGAALLPPHGALPRAIAFDDERAACLRRPARSRRAGPSLPRAAPRRAGGSSSPASSRPSGGSTTSTRRSRGSRPRTGPSRRHHRRRGSRRSCSPFTRLAADARDAGGRRARRRSQHARGARRPRRAGQGRQRARRSRPEAEEGRRAPARRALRGGASSRPRSSPRSSRSACSRRPPDVYRERTQAQRLAILGLTPEQIDARLAERTAARQAKDFARADALRKELDAKGIEVADAPEGTTWRVRPR